MKTEDFKTLLLSEEPERIVKNYMFKDLYLTEKQLGIVIDLKNKKIELKDVLKRFRKKRGNNGRRTN